MNPLKSTLDVHRKWDSMPDEIVINFLFSVVPYFLMRIVMVSYILYIQYIRCCFLLSFRFVAICCGTPSRKDRKGGATVVSWRSWIFGSDRSAVAEGLVGKLDLLFWSNRSCREGLYQLAQVWPWEGCLAQMVTGGFKMRQFCFPNFPADLQDKKHQKQDKNGGAPSKKESFPAKSFWRLWISKSCR